MRLIRTVIVLVTGLLVGGGYMASQYFYFTGQTARYKASVEGSSIPILSLILLLAIIVVSFLPAQEEELL